jgi:hypothetical protein
MGVGCSVSPCSKSAGVCVLVHVLLMPLVSTSVVTLVTRSILTQMMKCGFALIPNHLTSHVPLDTAPGREAGGFIASGLRFIH